MEPPIKEPKNFELVCFCLFRLGAIKKAKCGAWERSNAVLATNNNTPILRTERFPLILMIQLDQACYDALSADFWVDDQILHFVTHPIGREADGLRLSDWVCSSPSIQNYPFDIGAMRGRIEDNLRLIHFQFVHFMECTFTFFLKIVLVK